jgi:vitamin B12 transport system ATP-binding protein
MLKIKQLALESRFLPLSTRVSAGARVHIVGPNGAGKSSLLASIAGMLNATGEVSIDGQLITKLSGRELSRYRSYLCQQYLPLSTMPVFQYLFLHQPVGVEPVVLEKTLNNLCVNQHIDDKLSTAVTRLSGGEWQRVRLVAALLQVWPTINPQGALLLLDEPANSLDIAHQRAMDALIDEFCAVGGIALVTDHDLNHTLHHADWVWLMHKGKTVAMGTPQNVLQPENLTPVYDVDFKLQHFSGKSWIMTP